MTGTVTSKNKPPTLSAADRCDRCGAQARVHVVLLSGDLMFCSHHGKAYEQTLRDKAVTWLDESSAQQ